MSYSYASSIKSNKSDEFINVYIQRPIAGVVTFILFYLPVTPNFVTLLSTISGCVAGMLLCFPSPSFALIAILFYTKDILDSADGQLARAKQLYSRRGRFYDSLGDFVVHLFLFLGIFFQLHYNAVDFVSAVSVALIGFLGVNLRVSYQVFYQTAFLHQHNAYNNNRLSEELLPEDSRQDKFTLVLQKIFLFLYGWQDVLVKNFDNALLKFFISDEKRKQWYQHSTALLLNRFYGLGTEFIGLSLSLFFWGIKEYLFFSIGIMNALWLASIVQRIYLSLKR